MNTKPVDKENKPLPHELRRVTLFSVHPGEANNNNRIEPQTLLRDIHTEQVERLVEVIRRYIGAFRSEKRRYYRVTNTNHIKVYFDGSLNQANGSPPFCLTMTLVGFSDIATNNGDAPFLNINLVDCVDAHWLIELLKKALLVNETGGDDGVAA